MMDNLQSGITAFKAGKRDEARRYFIAAMRENPQNINVWGWLYQVSNTESERIQCLKKMLEINPSNAKAKELLDKLQAPPLVQSQPVIQQSNQPVEKKNNNLSLILFAVISVFVVLCCIIALSSSGSDTSILSNEINIKYVVNGTASSALITYTNQTGGTEQINAALPFIKEMIVEAGAIPSIVAQNSGSGTITCEIWINGEKKKTSTSTAQYGVVTCSDLVY